MMEYCALLFQNVILMLVAMRSRERDDVGCHKQSYQKRTGEEDRKQENECINTIDSICGHALGEEGSDYSIFINRKSKLRGSQRTDCNRFGSNCTNGSQTDYTNV